MTVDFEALAGDGPSRDQLERLTRLVLAQIELEDQIEAADKRLKQLQADHRKVSWEQIPDLLLEVGLSEVKLADGTKVVVKETLRVSTTGKYRDKINRWLEAGGHDDMIKDEVVVEFGKGEGEKASELVNDVRTYYSDRVDRKRYVNPQSFAAFLRELLADNQDVPLDELGAHVQTITELKRP